MTNVAITYKKTVSDVGYHCSCYDRGKECDICGKVPPPLGNFYRGPVRAPVDFSKHLVIEKPSIKK